MKNKAPYTQFGQTKWVPVVVYLNNKEVKTDKWDEEMWIENSNDMYGLMSSGLKDKRVRIVTREEWLRAKKYFTPEEVKAIQEKFPSICFGCDLARRSASDDNAEEGWVGCCAPLKLARKKSDPANFDPDNDIPIPDHISIADEVALGWVDLRSMPFDQSSGISSNHQLLTRGVKKCVEYHPKL